MQAVQTETNSTRGYSIALASAIILSTTGILIRYLTETYQMPALILAFWRDGFVVLTLLPVLRWLRPLLLRVERKHVRYLFGLGFVLAIFNSLWTLSVALNGAAVATVLIYSSAAFTSLLGRLILREPLTRVKLVVVVLSLVGCVLVAEAYETAVWQTNLSGIITGLGSGVLYAVYSLMGRSASQRGANPWTTMVYSFGFAAMFLLLINLLPEGVLPGMAAHPAEMFWLGNAVSGWVILFVLGAGPTLAGYGLYVVSLGHLPSSIANLIVTTEPVFTAVIAYFILGEILTGVQIGGSLMILSGVIFLRIYGE